MLRTFTVALVLLAAPAVALAHPAVDEARRLYEEAEFAAASAQLDQAEASDSLSREDLVRVLVLRMYLNLATSGQAALGDDLARILAVDPAYEPGPEAPPEVGEALAGLRGSLGPPLAVRATAHASDGGARIEATVDHDATRITRDVRVSARVAGAAPSVGSRSVTVPLAPGQSVDYWAEAIGPGGVVLAAEGDSSAPLSFVLDEGAAGAGGDDSTLFIVLGVVAGVLVVGAAVTVGVVLGTQGGPSDNTQPGLPTIAVAP